jgi:hypothetical protein
MAPADAQHQIVAARVDDIVRAGECLQRFPVQGGRVRNHHGRIDSQDKCGTILIAAQASA